MQLLLMELEQSMQVPVLLPALWASAGRTAREELTTQLHTHNDGSETLAAHVNRSRLCRNDNGISAVFPSSGQLGERATVATLVRAGKQKHQPGGNSPGNLRWSHCNTGWTKLRDP